MPFIAEVQSDWKGAKRRRRTVGDGSRRVLSCARSWLWIGMLLLHAPAAVSLFAQLSNIESLDLGVALPRILGMGCSCVFFALKAFDVPWLRLRPSWHTGVVFALVVILIHLGAIDKACSGDLELSPYSLGFVLVCGTMSAVEILADVVRRLRCIAHAADRHASLALVRSHTIRRQHDRRPSRPTHVFSFGALRAPPSA